ncbi:hypothetical protein [Priestia taiwanensis]|uniref:Uncharacterized protein n=1 Tax=Priestia taiwanensis TaxID=1347902 RepID=A0A917AJD1_9BACI|nr:hypothetical protein [Priestia taiwanensis]MBM7361841.1 hypothetical protein [Priestia taiwanensis]GGE57351.1 hypothetical protein GCM10007140_04670 [Priestia taiwanensis]
MRKDSIEKIRIRNEVIEEVKDEICRTHVNGGVIIECFQIHNEEVLHTPDFIEENAAYFMSILTSEDIKAAIPQLYKGCHSYFQPTFTPCCQFTVDGGIARSIYCGGAYERFYGTPKEAKKLAEKLCDVMFEDRLFDIEAYKTNEAWCSWFYDVAWDDTWFIIDKKLKRFWLICITDTD